MPIIPTLQEDEAGGSQVAAQPGQLRDLVRLYLKKWKGLGSSSG